MDARRDPPQSITNADIAAGNPRIARGYAREWVACRSWTFADFRKRFAEAPVTVNFGRYEPDPSGTGLAYSRRGKETAFGEYLSRLHLEPDERGYVSAHGFDGPFRPLRDDIELADRTSRPNLERRTFWVSGAGTNTQLHFDRADNILVQVVGRKRLTLYSPARTLELRAVPVRSNWAVDVSELELPSSTDNLPAPDYDFVLEPGDAVFIPYGWWHKVVSLDDSISVNHWWWGDGVAFTKAPELMRTRLRVGVAVAQAYAKTQIRMGVERVRSRLRV